MSQESNLTARLSLTPDRAVGHGLAEMTNTGFDDNATGQDSHKQAANVDTTSLLGSVWNLFRDAKDIAAREIDRLLEQLPYSSNQRPSSGKDRVLQPKKDNSKIMLGHGPSSIQSKRLGASSINRHWSRLVNEELRAQTNDLTPGSRVKALRAGSAPLLQEHSFQESYTPSPRAYIQESPTIPPTSIATSSSMSSTTSMKRKHINPPTAPSKSPALESKKSTKYSRRQGSSAFNSITSRPRHSSTLSKRAYHRHMDMESEGWGSSTSTPGGYEEDSESSFGSSAEDDFHKDRESSVTQSIAALADLMNLSDSQSSGSRYPPLSHRRSESEHSSRRRSRRISGRHRPWSKTDDDDDTGDSDGRRTARRPRSALDIYSSADPMRTFIPSRPTTPQPRPPSQLSSHTSQTPSQPTSEDHDKLNQLQEELAAIKAQLATLVSAQQEDSRRLSWPAAAMPSSSIPPPPPPPPPPPVSNATKKWSIPNSEAAKSMQNVLKELSSSQHRLRKTNSPYLARIYAETATTSTTTSQISETAADDNPTSNIGMQKSVLTTAALRARRSEALPTEISNHAGAGAEGAQEPQELHKIPSTLTSVTPTERNNSSSNDSSPNAPFQLWARRRTATPQATQPKTITPSSSSSSSSSSPIDSLRHTPTRQETMSSDKKKSLFSQPFVSLTPSLTPLTSNSSASLPVEGTPTVEEPELMDLSVENHHRHPVSLPSSAFKASISSSTAHTKRKRSVGGEGGVKAGGLSHAFALLEGGSGSGGRVRKAANRGGGGGANVGTGAFRNLTSSMSRRSGSSKSTATLTGPPIVQSTVPTKSVTTTSASVNSRGATAWTPTGTVGRPLPSLGFKRPLPSRSGSSSSSTSTVSTLHRSLTDPTHLSSAPSSSAPVHDAKRAHLLKSQRENSRNKDKLVASSTVTAPTDPQRKQVTFASTTTPSSSSSSSPAPSPPPSFSLHGTETSYQNERERQWFRELDNDSWRVNH